MYKHKMEKLLVVVHWPKDQNKKLALWFHSLIIVICVPCCHNQPKVGNDFFELISSSDAEEKELSNKSKIVFL